LSVDVLDYSRALKQENARKIIQFIAENGGSATYKEILDATSLTPSTIRHHLARLEIDFHLIRERKSRSPYSLVHRSPLCFIFSKRQGKKITYFGLLGKRDERDRDPETITAKEILDRKGFEIESAYVLTTHSGIQSWSAEKRLEELNISWIVCSDKDVGSIQALTHKIWKRVSSELENHFVLMDCTSLTKPATIAYFKIASTLMLPLIYVSEENKTLTWIISIEEIRNLILNGRGLQSSGRRSE
jgi:DNA-binding transcriptional ArsR family regulator